MVSRCPLLGLILTNLFRNRPHIYFSPSHWEPLTSVLQSYWQGWSLCSTAIHPGDSFYSLCFTNSRFMRTSLLSFSPSSSFSIFQTFFFFLQTHLPPPYLFPLPPLACFPPPLVSSFISLQEKAPFLPLVLPGVTPLCSSFTSSASPGYVTPSVCSPGGFCQSPGHKAALITRPLPTFHQPVDTYIVSLCCFPDLLSVVVGSKLQ